MRLLLHPVDRRTTPVGLVVSLVLHTAVIAAVAAAARERPVPSEQVEAFVRLILPPNRPTGTGAGATAAWARPASEPAGERGPERATPLGTGPVEGPGGDTTAVEPRAGAGGPATVLTELEVDTAVERLPGSASPAYPAELLRRNVEGSVSITYIVDTVGLADSSSIRVVAATDPGFVEAVRDALPRMRFRPALLGGVKVRQLVQQTFSFRIRRQEQGTPPPPLILRGQTPRSHGP